MLCQSGKQRQFVVHEYGAIVQAHSIIVPKDFCLIFNSDKEFNILAFLLKVGTVFAI